MDLVVSVSWAVLVTLDWSIDDPRELDLLTGRGASSEFVFEDPDAIHGSTCSF